MGRRVLISIVSEQTIPNYLFIKEFQKEVDKFIFISTDDMEKKGKTSAITKTAGINKKERNKILIQEGTLFAGIEKLDKLNLSNDDEYLINLTGGTKTMSITVWQYFHKFRNVRYFYVPIGKNTYKEVFESKTAEETKFTYRISIKEYLSIYGIRYEKADKFLTEAEAFNIYENYVNNYFDYEGLLKYKFNRNFINLSRQQKASKWFEEFLYYKIKVILELSDNQIETSVKLFDKENEKNIQDYSNDNEIDVIFIKDNNIYIVEAKITLGNSKINSQSLYNALFKIAAVNKRFGLRAKPVLMTLSNLYNNPARKKNIMRRCKLLNMSNPFDIQSFIDNNFENKINEFVK